MRYAIARGFICTADDASRVTLNSKIVCRVEEVNDTLLAMLVKQANNAPKVAQAAAALLSKIDNLTTDDFQKGGERLEREALREVLAGLESL